MNTTVELNQDIDVIPVLFRIDRSGPFKDGQHVDAVFPTLPADYAGNLMTCYAHVGQHSGCDYGWYSRTRSAKPEEYADLLAELESIGYRLKVYRRMQPWMREELKAEVDRQKAFLTKP